MLFGLVDGGTVVSHQRRAGGQLDGLAALHVVRLHAALEFARADAQKGDAVAVVFVHVGLYFEDKAGKLLAGRVNGFTGCGVKAELGPERKEIEYEQPRRRAGKTHNNWYTLFDVAMLSFTSYTKVGMRVAEFFGFGVALISFLIGLLYLIAKLVMWDFFAAGYAPTMIVVFFMGGVQLAFLGFLGSISWP